MKRIIREIKIRFRRLEGNGRLFLTCHKTIIILLVSINSILFFYQYLLDGGGSVNGKQGLINFGARQVRSNV